LEVQGLVSSIVYKRQKSEGEEASMGAGGPRSSASESYPVEDQPLALKPSASSPQAGEVSRKLVGSPFPELIWDCGIMITGSDAPNRMLKEATVSFVRHSPDQPQFILLSVLLCFEVLNAGDAPHARFTVKNWLEKEEVAVQKHERALAVVLLQKYISWARKQVGFGYKAATLFFESAGASLFNFKKPQLQALFNKLQGVKESRKAPAPYPVTNPTQLNYIFSLTETSKEILSEESSDPRNPSMKILLVDVDPAHNNSMWYEKQVAPVSSVAKVTSLPQLHI